MLNCKQVAHLVASEDLASAGSLMRLRVRMHLFICRGCKHYAEQLRIIGSVARDRWRSFTGSKETIARLEKAILDDAFGVSEEKQ